MAMTLEDAFALDGASYSLKKLESSAGIGSSTLELTIITKK